MNTEELRIYLRTVADTKGVQQTQQSLAGMQRQTATIGRSSVVGLGLMAGAAGAAAGSVAGLVGSLGDSIDVLRDHERIARATAMAYGQNAEQFQRFATQLSAQTGFTSDAILEAALSARTLSQNYGLSIDQTQRLIKVSADLARVRGIGVAEAFERVQSAIRGEAEASEYLGLTLNDTFLRNQAMNGSLRQTYDRMTDQQKAQVRYAELLKQSAQFTDLAKNQTNSLDTAFGKAAKSGRELQIALGEFAKPATIGGLQSAAKLLDGINVALRETAELWGRINRLQVPGIAALEGPGGARQRMRQDIAELNRLGVGLLQQAQREAQATGRRAGVPTPEEFQKQLTAYRAQQARLGAQQRRLAELNELPVAAAESAARLAFLDQVDATVRDVTAAQQRQVELERESVNLAAQEAQIRLSMLPAQQRMAELQRQMTEQQIAARRAALPATEALEDLRYMEQRARLIAANRGVSAAERIDARRQLREIARQAPGAELRALEAGRPVTLAERAATRLGMEQQLFEISTQRQLQQITEQRTANGYLSTIAGQRTQAIELTINLGTDAFKTEVYKELLEAEQQSQGPTTIKLSGVRR